MAGAKLNVTVLGIFLVVALLLSGGAAMEGTIDYHAMGADEEPGKDRALFRPGDVANKYTRGCESSEECRGK
ncbi:hypothetical protein PVAP13_2KG143800 [Panicum virgatum]|jgi:hypothetical protein|uniref:Uncharacterized protein n=1 Tax=Panicum virgatum TaxID=38727 RepID=A0A8T0W177_PANVG|nr:hypothetical protein PVAP13_2KG143800 [Panicum virgatum]